MPAFVAQQAGPREENRMSHGSKTDVGASSGTAEPFLFTADRHSLCYRTSSWCIPPNGDWGHPTLLDRGGGHLLRVAHSLFDQYSPADAEHRWNDLSRSCGVLFVHLMDGARAWPLALLLGAASLVHDCFCTSYFWCLLFWCLIFLEQLQCYSKMDCLGLWHVGVTKRLHQIEPKRGKRDNPQVAVCCVPVDSVFGTCTLHTIRRALKVACIARS